MANINSMGEEAERRLKGEMSELDDDSLIARSMKSPGHATGVAARQILEERRRNEEASRHDRVMQALQRPRHYETFVVPDSPLNFQDTSPLPRGREARRRPGRRGDAQNPQNDPSA